MNCGFTRNIPQLPRKRKYKSLYLGEVELPLTDGRLECIHRGVLIKVIDAKQFRLKHNRRYTLESLRLLKSAKARHSSPGIDILFNTVNYLEFLLETTGKTNVIEGDLLISLFNFDKLDNAFFNGVYMVYGNGHKIFEPLVSPDTIGHELSHGIVSKLNYAGESGAINESISDCFGTSYEFWLYNRFNTDNDPYNDLTLLPNYTIGEGVVIKKSALRSLENPQLFKQPSKYQGKYWVNPKRLDFDKGGVHINSGVLNHLFYLLSQEMTVKKATELFYRVLQRLTPNCTFKEFSSKIKNVCNYEDYQIIIKSLRKISL
jgi:hypothetical protein